MIDVRPTIKKKPFDLIERRRAQIFEEAKPESLSGRRVDLIEHCVCSCALHPLGAAVGEHSAPGLGELDAGVPFRSLQTS